MVSNVVGLNFQEVNELADEIFLVGDWFMSVTNVDKDENHNVKIYGPYETDQQAMEHARKTLSVTTFRISVWAQKAPQKQISSVRIMYNRVNNKKGF